MSWVSITRATSAHREPVLSMQRELLACGGGILPTDHNIELYGGLFDSYIDGAVPGAVFVAKSNAESGDVIVGFTMAGELPETFETVWGHTAMGWGTFVKAEYRSSGLAKRLRLHLDSALRDLGFDTVIGGYDPANAAAAQSVQSSGFKVFQYLGAKSLREAV